MDLSKKVFGSNVDEDIRKHINKLQQGNFEIKPSDPVDPKLESYLGDRTPYVRMWTAVNVKKVKKVKDDKTGKYKWVEVKDVKQTTVYSINENRDKSYDELGSIEKTDYGYNPDLQKNPYLFFLQK